MGLDPVSWMRLTFKELWAVRLGFLKKENDKYKDNLWWIRWQTFQILSPYLDKGSIPEDLISLPGDTKKAARPAPEPNSPERMQAAKKKLGLK